MKLSHVEKPEVVILCGGKGSRLSEEPILKPKPMVEIGGRPILWHIMKRVRMNLAANNRDFPPCNTCDVVWNTHRAWSL